MKRGIDVALALGLLVILLLPMIVIGILVRFSSPGPIIFWSKRIGRNNVPFRMPKFRTMQNETPVIASHLLTKPSTYITPVGSFLRKTSADELPQLWTILKGDMSFVGPRPALFNQYDLVSLRTSRGIHAITPGLTGLAQIKGRDDLAIEQKVAIDEDYLKRQSVWLDVQILMRTAKNVLVGVGVSH